MRMSLVCRPDTVFQLLKAELELSNFLVNIENTQRLLVHLASKGGEVIEILI